MTARRPLRNAWPVLGIAVVLLGAAWLSVSAAGSGAAVTVSIASFQFSPRVVGAHPGDTVTWTNYDNYAHTVTSDPSQISAYGPNSDTQFPNGIPPEQSYSWTVPGNAPAGITWYYYCRFHGVPGDGTTFGQGMTGAVTIAP